MSSTVLQYFVTMSIFQTTNNSRNFPGEHSKTTIRALVEEIDDYEDFVTFIKKNSKSIIT